jgi:hypothetical protein
MPIYRLTPIEGAEDRRAWKASMIKPVCLWVHAMDEQDARQVVMHAMAVRKKSISPWKDARLVSCTCDDCIWVPPGIIRVRNGKASQAVSRSDRRPDIEPNHDAEQRP